MKLVRLAAAAAAIAIFLTACAHSPEPEPEPEPGILPSIYVTTDSGSAIREREYERVTVSLSGSPEGEYDFGDLPAQMKCRGNSTFHHPKKPYRIKFDEKINLLGQGDGPSKSWVLLANFIDQSSLRNHVAFAMGKRLDAIGFTTSSSFVHLYMNGVYRGVYELVEHHGEGKYRIDMDEDQDEIDTDYLIELDDYLKIRGVNIPYAFETGGRTYAIHSDFMNVPKWKFLYHWFQEIDAATASGERERVEELIDVPSFVDAYILEEISKDPDGGISSFFYLKKGGGKLFCTCPWDFDFAFGNEKNLDGGRPDGLYIGNRAYLGEDQEYPTSVWFSDLMATGWFSALVAERWAEKRDELLAAATGAIDDTVTRYGAEMVKNFDAWALTGDAEKWPTYASDLRDWIVARFEFLDTAFAAG